MEKAMDSYNKGGGAGEVRRINVVYFLSRGGRTDHPHLFRVNHLHRSGVRLRDVKRWLSEVRGKDMPENFSWAYKRGGSDDDEDRRDTTPVCPGMDGCGIHMNRKVRLRRSGKDKAKPEGGKRPGAVAAAHKPASLPLCSQCGKEFKPQDLHSHMQSCRGFRARMRSSNGTRGVDRNHTRSARADDSSPERTSTGLLLTQS
ncbi:hypothetical protein TRIUR3_03751 [Triticum urartu]|uniref:SOSEKI DIX-like domain-containing protein n=1 Tax=Triticum urartu TaxID=4572 RepID=M8A9D2_TRIUA|nr:hypothetical protein TRIUR3_03751 [Triticum urartu]